LNKDDRSYSLIVSKWHGLKVSKLITYAIKHKADYTPTNFSFTTQLPGEYNQYNCLAAIAAAKQLGIDNQTIRHAVSLFKGVIGRMEEIPTKHHYRIIVDFAHTPNALSNVLTTLRLQKPKRLIVIFGCAGLRDIEKRPLMGEIAVRLADLAVLTAEDPRTENVNQIIDHMVKGCYRAYGIEGKNFIREPDRRFAIRSTIKTAQTGDLIVICGKGHEKSMCFGKTEIPWSDQEEVKKALKLLND
jgi:UDP-N-acetylmuramoyl-L-alanyl-D-glutamate--2,6-diaminopimelate ligase